MKIRRFIFLLFEKRGFLLCVMIIRVSCIFFFGIFLFFHLSEIEYWRKQEIITMLCLVAKKN